MQLDQPGGHHGQIHEHVARTKELTKCGTRLGDIAPSFHQFIVGLARALVPTPGTRERLDLRGGAIAVLALE